jgi:hypothetical protein
LQNDYFSLLHLAARRYSFDFFTLRAVEEVLILRKCGRQEIARNRWNVGMDPAPWEAQMKETVPCV